MMTIERVDIAKALHAVDVAHGDVAMIHSDISRIGWITGARSREEVLTCYFNAIFDVLGETGTLATLACTESYAREQRPFEHENSVSEQGILSEYARTQPGAVRSMHPLFSVSALGPKANVICADGLAQTAFGYDSPFYRLRELDARIVCIGVDLLATTFVHHIEQTFGVPYGYTKEWSPPIRSCGETVRRRFFAFVRYLDAGVEYDFTRMQDDLLTLGLAKRAVLGYGAVWSVRVRDIFEHGMDRLKDDPFYFLAAPPTEEPWRR